MEKLKEEFKKEVKNIIGVRTIDGNCRFCGKAVNDKYCNCDEAQKQNKYFKKIYKIISRYNNLITFDETKESAQATFKKRAETPPLFEGYTFKDYTVECDSEKKCKSAVQEYFNNSIFNFIYGKNLLLIGKSGTGKTMLESILCNLLSGVWLFECRFINAIDLKGEITRCFSSKSNKTVNEVVNVYKEADFLFLDDIDKLTPTEYVKEFIYSLVNYRIEHQLPIISSANHSLEELDSKYYDEVIVSRLINNSPVVIFTHNNRRF